MPLPAVALLLAAAADPRLASALERVSEEAALFLAKAPNIIGEERLTHKGRSALARFRRRPGAPGPEFETAGYRKVELSSEFAFGFLPAAPDQLRELRQVVAVNGRTVLRRESARMSLSEGMKSDIDRVNKQMLQDLENHGLVGAATDFSQMILLFQRPSLASYEFTWGRTAEIDGQPAVAIAYRQKQGSGAQIFHSRRVDQVPMRGELWIRQSDSLPLRITMSATIHEETGRILHEGTVDYRTGPNGFLIPLRSHYRKSIGRFLLVDNQAAYSGFKMFRADTEIKFSTEADPPEPERKP